MSNKKEKKTSCTNSDAYDVKKFAPDFTPSKITKLKKDEALSIYHDMQLIRRFEEKAGQLYGMGLIGGFCHLYIGQEAVVTGFKQAQRPEDSVITTYRDHGHMLSCEMDPKGVMAELTGRIGGYSKGKGGSMHMFSKEKNFFGGHGIVGASVPLGAGLAFAHKYLEEKETINFCYFGDGAANQGQVYETMNMASLWKLPIVFIIENNRYAMGTSQSRHAAANDRLHLRGQGYDIPGIKVDGMDVLKVREAANAVTEYVRAGNGPVIVEVETYRYRGHSMSDPATYRTKDELNKYKNELDPIKNFKTWLLDEKLASEDEIKAIDKDIKAIIKETEQFAK